ncbi:MAG: hypothetical protein HY581_04910 [Nitrospirae bacterium]|nr:hypothetical protein [Nitrospirota bacterium]
MDSEPTKGEVPHACPTLDRVTGVLRLIINTLCRLINSLHKPADPTDSVLPLVPATPTNIDFDGFTKGIDNVHIDVRLSPQFMSQAKGIVASILDQQTGRAGGKSSGPTTKEWEEFRTTYAHMLEAAIHRAKSAGQLSLVQLVQLAAVKFLLRQVQTELDALRQNLRAAVASFGSTSDTKKIQLNEWLSWLARNRTKLRYKVTHQVFEQLFKIESGAIAELRYSLLGERWPVPQEMLFNPLLQAENPLDDEIMMKQYVLLGQDLDDVYSFASIDSFLPYLFRRRRPTNEREMTLVRAEQAHQHLVTELDRVRRKHERGGSFPAVTARLNELEEQANKSNAELEQARADYLKDSFAWADLPANADILFNEELTQEHIRAAKKAKDRKHVAKLKAHIKVQRRLLGVAERRFRTAGLLPQIVAAYEMLPFSRDSTAVLNPQQLRQFLSGGAQRKAIWHTLKDKQLLASKAPSIEPLVQAARRVDRLSCRQQRRYLMRFLRDFVTFRRDLSHYHLAHKLMNSIQLQDDAKNIRLSRANNTLYEFLVSKEEEVIAQTILSHVVLKADVRGSTTMVAELRNRGLNPASHFSLNFFAPLNELLGTYGATKVFVEGDAVILALLEYQEAAAHRLSVARACGLAKRLLNVVYAQNALSKKSGLPELELGIGLVYAEEPPAFLYDGENQIMISSAISKADRLSSCSWQLRKHLSQRHNSCTNVEIYEVPEGNPLRGEKGQIHLRYNVNGIELDSAGFTKLRSEITLQRIELVVPGDDCPTTFNVGRYPDLKGALHHVVIREGRIRLYDVQAPHFGHLTSGPFYEVVTNQALLDQVNAAMKAG